MTLEFIDVTRIGPFSIGEKPEPLQITIQDYNGTAINLTGYTATFIIEAVDQTVSSLGGGTSSIPTPASGITQYIWHANDFLTAGLYRAQMWAGNGTYRYASKIFEWFVQDATTAPNV